MPPIQQLARIALAGVPVIHPATRNGRCLTDVFVRSANGATRQVTTDPEPDESPSWSPDGTRIAFASNRDGDDEIYVVEADGAGLVQLTDDDPSDSSPAWYPKGSEIAYTSGSDGQVHLIAADGTRDRALTSQAGGHGTARPSPTT